MDKKNERFSRRDFVKATAGASLLDAANLQAAAWAQV